MGSKLDTRSLLIGLLQRQIATLSGAVVITGDHPALGDPAGLQALADNLDAGYRPTVDDGSIPAVLYVDTDAGDDDNNGQAPGSPVLTLARALQFCPLWPNATRTIQITGATPAELPSTSSLLNRITLRGTRGAVVAGSITGIGASSRAAGLLITTSLGALGLGDLVAFTSGALAGQYGRVYQVAGLVSSVTQSGLTWTAPAPGDTFEVVPTPTELRAPVTGAPALTASHQCRIEELTFTDASPETLLGLATDSIVIERCTLALRTLISGRGGSITLGACYMANTGQSFNQRGMLQVATGGTLTLTRGTVITGSAASSAAVAHVSVITEGVLELSSEVVLDQLGTEGVLCLGAEVVAKRETIGPEPTLRLNQCAQGWRYNPGNEGVSGSGDLPDTFGQVLDVGSYVVTAQRGSWVRLGSASSCTSGIGLNAVSADGGGSNVATATDQTRIEGGAPAPGPAALPAGYLTGLELTWLSATTIQIEPGAARDQTDSADLRTVAAVGVDTAVIGAGGLDVGPLAVSSWYAVWLIADSSGVNPGSAVASLSYAAPAFPVGYDVARFVGSFRVFSTAAILAFVQGGRSLDRRSEYLCDRANVRALSNGVSAAWFSVDCSAFLPPSFAAAYLLGIGKAGDGRMRTPGNATAQGQIAVINGASQFVPIELACVGRAVEYKTTGTLDIDVLAYTESL